MAHTVDNFFQKTGRSDVRRCATKCVEFFSYCELVVILFFVIFAFLSVVYSDEGLSNRIYSFIWLFVGVHVFASIVIRLYYQSKFLYMYDRSQLIGGIPENYRRTFVIMFAYFCFVSTTLVTFPLLYVISFGSAQMGDPFSFPVADVLPGKTGNVTVYVCKYFVYSFILYVTLLESGFLNLTFVYFTGVVKKYFQILDEEVREAMVDKDERKLKIAIKRHQELLKLFKDMETVYEKPLIITIEFCGFYVGFNSYIMIQCIQGVIHPIILAFCVASNLASLLTMSIYCYCGSNMYDLVCSPRILFYNIFILLLLIQYQHDGILKSLFEHESCYSKKKSLQKLILMMMTRATLPLEVKAGSIFTINLNLLVKILKFTYTVFNLFLSSVSRQLKETTAI